jgi:hypothetical protein
MNKWICGEWIVDYTNAKQRRALHYWLTILWLTAGTSIWLLLRDALWFVGFMSLYAIWISHLAGWAAETPVEPEDSGPLSESEPRGETGAAPERRLAPQHPT